MEELLRTIEQAVRDRGWSARQASMEAVGTPELISNMRRGRVPSVERFRALCDVLNLEFYVGPHREGVEVDENRLELAIEAAERGLSMNEREMDFPEKARLVAAVYQLIGKEAGASDAARVRRVIGMVAGTGREGSGPERVLRMARDRKGGRSK